MEMFVAQAGAHRVGNPVTATYGIEAGKIDMELLLPIDKQFHYLMRHISRMQKS